MAKFFKKLREADKAFIARQKIFFVATAMSEGRVNVSPKGMDTFRVLDDQTVSFLNLTGSANETAAHVSVDGRITLMFCSFETQPLILRLYGQGRMIYPQDSDWSTESSRFPDLPGKRQILIIQVELIQTSCGYAVPFFNFQGERPQLVQWAERKGEEGIHAYWAANNRTSMDGVSIPQISTDHAPSKGEPHTP